MRTLIKFLKLLAIGYVCGIALVYAVESAKACGTEAYETTTIKLKCDGCR